MNIGIDFDGVINTNNATAMTTIENAIADSLGYRVVNPKALNSKDRYGFTNTDYNTYQTLRHDQINAPHFFTDMRMMAGVDNAIRTLNAKGHQTYLVTVRGCDSNGELDEDVRRYVHEVLKKWGLVDCGLRIDENHSFFDPTKKQIDKATQCKNLGVTLLVDDSDKNIAKMRQANLSGIYFGVEAENWQVVVEQIQKLA